MREFTTVASLKTQTLRAGQTVTTQGYAVAGDGGAGRYLVKTAAQAASDGDVIDEIGEGFTLTKGNVVVLQSGGVTRLEHYGAVGDGVTVDTLAINKAISKGGLVTGILGKTYVVDQNLILRSDLVLENATFDMTAAPINSTPIRAIGSLLPGPVQDADIQHGQRIITVVDTTGFKSGDWLVLKSDKVWSTVDGTTTGEAMMIQSILSSTRIELSNTTDDAYLLADNAEILLYPETYKNITLRNITMFGPSVAVQTYGMYFASANNVLIEDCNIKGFANSGINIDDCINVRIVNNEMEDFMRSGVGYCVVTSGYSRNILIDGNRLMHSRTAVTSGGTEGVCRDVKVTNNHCAGNFSACIGTKNSASGWIVDGNTCEGNIDNSGLGSGIRMAGRDFTVTNNIIRGYFVVPLSCFVYGDNSATGNKIIISGNIIKDSTTISINVTLQEAGDVISGVHITNNIIEMLDTADAVKFDGVIYVRGRGGVIRNIIIANNTVINANMHCVDVRAVAPGVVKNLLVQGNILEQTVAADTHASAFYVKTDSITGTTSNVNNLETVNS